MAEPSPLLGIPVVVTDTLPTIPGHRENARRLVRRGLYEAFPWLKGDPGPNPDERLRAISVPPRATPSLTERIDAAMITDGHDPECVTWVCEEHRRHCSRITTDHTEHACCWCD